MQEFKRTVLPAVVTMGLMIMSGCGGGDGGGSPAPAKVSNEAGLGTGGISPAVHLIGELPLKSDDVLSGMSNVSVGVDRSGGTFVFYYVGKNSERKGYWTRGGMGATAPLKEVEVSAPVLRGVDNFPELIMGENGGGVLLPMDTLVSTGGIGKSVEMNGRPFDDVVNQRAWTDLGLVTTVDVTDVNVWTRESRVYVLTPDAKWTRLLADVPPKSFPSQSSIKSGIFVNSYGEGYLIQMREGVGFNDRCNTALYADSVMLGPNTSAPVGSAILPHCDMVVGLYGGMNGALNKEGYGVVLLQPYGGSLNVMKVDVQNLARTTIKRLSSKVWREPKVAVAPTGESIVVFDDDERGSMFFSRSTKTEDWTTPAKVDPDVIWRNYQWSFSANDQGQAVVAYISAHENALAVFAKRYTPGAGWGPAKKIAQACDHRHVGAAMSPAGVGYIVFDGFPCKYEYQPSKDPALGLSLPEANSKQLKLYMARVE